VIARKPHVLACMRFPYYFALMQKGGRVRIAYAVLDAFAHNRCGQFSNRTINTRLPTHPLPNVTPSRVTRRRDEAVQVAASHNNEMNSACDGTEVRAVRRPPPPPISVSSEAPFKR